MSDVVCISPPGSTAERLYSMTEVGELAAILKKDGWRVTVIDGIYYHQDIPRIVSLIDNEKPLLVFLVLQWEHQPFFQWTEQLIASLNECKAKFHLAAVGRAATVCYQRIFRKYAALDSIIRGEKERTAVELLTRIKNARDWRSQKGIACRSNGAPVVNEPQAPILDLDSLPFAERAYLRDKRLYPIAPMHTSRYCYGSCNFCINKIYRDTAPDQPYRARSATSVVDEMEMIYHTYGTKTFCFVDNNFFVDGDRGKVRAREIAEQLLDRQLKIWFYIESRVNEVEFDLFQLLKKAGLRKVFLGIESGCQVVLDRFHKEATIAMNETAISTLRELNIGWEPGFILFDPLTTLSELKQNIEFIKKHELYKCKFTADMSLFNTLGVYPGALIERQIPPALFQKNETRHGEIPYVIKDPKVQLAREMLSSFHQRFFSWIDEYNWQIQALMDHIAGNIHHAHANEEMMKTMQQRIFDFQKKLARWEDGRKLLTVEILEKIVYTLDQQGAIDERTAAALAAIVTDGLSAHHVAHFEKNFEEQLSEIKSWWWGV